MGGQHLGVIHLINVVAGEDHNIVGIIEIHKADILVNGVRSSLEPLALLSAALVGGQNISAAVPAVQIPRAAGADIAVELEGLVLGQHAHSVDAGVGAVGEGKVDDPVFAAKGDAGFCHVTGQGIETGTLPAGQKHGDAFSFHMKKSFLWNP